MYRRKPAFPSDWSIGSAPEAWLSHTPIATTVTLAGVPGGLSPWGWAAGDECGHALLDCLGGSLSVRRVFEE